jgi:glycosyltransferase involved in cell wall biosynthesis
MRITFIVPSLNTTGGLRVVSIYAKFLASQGHTVTVVSPNKKKPDLKERVKLLIKPGFHLKDYFDTTFFDNADFEVKILNRHRPVKAEDIPEADIVIATFWNTAEWIAEYPKNKGIKVYFIQHYEIHSWLPIERVKATLRQPFKKIVVSQWIADILKNEYADSEVIVVPNGVDEKQFATPARCKQLVPTVGMMYSERDFKGCDIGFAAFCEAKKTIPNLKLVAFGLEVADASLPIDTEYFLQPNQAQLKDIYSQCDVWLFTSRSEGFGLPILEAMACRTPVIGTQCGAAPELINNSNGLLTAIDDIAAITSAIIQFATMPNKEWIKTSNAALETSQKYHWADSCHVFETSLLSFLSASNRPNITIRNVGEVTPITYI